MKDLTSLTVRRGRSWWVATVLILVALATIGLLGEAEHDPSPLDSLPAGFDSTTVVQLQDELPQGEGTSAVILYTADSGGLSDEALTTLRQRHPASDQGPGLVVSEDGTAAVAVVSVPDDGAEATADAVTEIRADAAEGLPAGVTSQVTGPAAVQADLAAVFDGADLRLLLATAARGRRAAADHLPQPDPVDRPAGRGRASPTSSPRSWRPHPGGRLDFLGRVHRGHPVASWCSAPPPTTPCCSSPATARSCTVNRTASPPCAAPCGAPPNPSSPGGHRRPRRAHPAAVRASDHPRARRGLRHRCRGRRPSPPCSSSPPSS